MEKTETTIGETNTVTNTNEMEPYVSDDTVEAWKRGVWLYLLDHTTPHERGHIIRFIVRDENDFWWRVLQRKEGKYQRNDPVAVARRVEARIWGNHRRSRVDKTLFYLRAHGSLYVRFLLALRGYLNKKAERIALSPACRRHARRYKLFDPIVDDDANL